MKNRKGKLRFSMSIAKLLDISYKKQALLEQDEAVLNARGITTARIAAFENLRNAFLNIPQNKTVAAEVTIVKENRDADLQQLKQLIKEVWGIAKTSFGSSSVLYKTFGSTSISKLNAKKTAELALKVGSNAAHHFTAMQPKGLTTQMLTNIESLRESVTVKSGNTDVAKIEKTGITTTRIDAANALFDELQNMCNTAYVYFESRNKLRAKSYVIYKVAGKYQQCTGKVIAGKIINRKIKAVVAKTVFKLQVSSGNALVFYFSKSPNGTDSIKKVIVSVNTKLFTKCTAADLGFNRSKGYIYFCIDNTAEAADTAQYKVKIS